MKVIWNGTEIDLTSFTGLSYHTEEGKRYALSKEDGRPRASSEQVNCFVPHSTVGSPELTILPGFGRATDLAERNALSWRRKRKDGAPVSVSGTQIIVDQDGQVLFLCDPVKTVGFGAGHPRGNGNAINIEMAASAGNVLYKEQVITTARLIDTMAELLGAPKIAIEPRQKANTFSPALAARNSSWAMCADHCAWSRNRGIGDAGFVVSSALVRYGWRLVNPDSHTSTQPIAWPEKPPSWLQAKNEILQSSQQPQGENTDEILEFLGCCLDVGLSPAQCVELAAHAFLESGRFLKDVGYNWWGWKCKKSYGLDQKWWRRLGHQKSGDGVVCYYRAFPNAETSIKEFVKHFAPQNNEEAKSSSGRYRIAGVAFWSEHPESWIAEIIAAGYRGPMTAESPHESIETHRQLVDRVIVLWLQKLLGVVVDGIWGPKSRKALIDRLGLSEPSISAILG